VTRISVDIIAAIVVDGTNKLKLLPPKALR